MLKYEYLPLIAAVLAACSDHSETAADLLPQDAAAEKRINELSGWVNSLRFIWTKRNACEATTFQAYKLGKMVRCGCLELQCDVNKTEGQVPSWHPRLKKKWCTRVKQPLANLVRDIHRDPGVRSRFEYDLLRRQLHENIWEGNAQQARSLLELAASTLQVPKGHRYYKLWKQTAFLAPDADLPRLDATVTKEWEGMSLQITDVGRGVKIDGKHYLVGDWIDSSLKLVSIDSERVYFDYRGCRVSWPW